MVIFCYRLGCILITVNIPARLGGGTFMPKIEPFEQFSKAYDEWFEKKTPRLTGRSWSLFAVSFQPIPGPKVWKLE